ncbi:hypothetical protein [Polycladidibacter hongkongensis]|uniref:hypothetical protein n=1 Tax=Polycladidibacter hongkongensis TaxID=1647556 RepID=UPI00082CAECB|nr:hypothetical protein [Pseudovibrio hongkongensis]
MRYITIAINIACIVSFKLSGFDFTHQGDIRYMLLVYTGLLGLVYLAASGLVALPVIWVRRYFSDRANARALQVKAHKRYATYSLIPIIGHFILVQVPAVPLSSQFVASLSTEGAVLINGHHLATVFGKALAHFAMPLGEISFYILLIIMAAGLSGMVAYRRFKWIHKLSALVLITGAAHSMFLLPNLQEFALVWLACTLASGVAVVCGLHQLFAGNRRATTLPNVLRRNGSQKLL